MKKHITALVDDRDGSEAVETVSFSFDGVHYETDLNAANATKLRTELEKWAQLAARKTPASRRRAARKTVKTAKRPGLRGVPTGDIRDWARQNGHKVADRGRIPAPVRQAYNRAHLHKAS